MQLVVFTIGMLLASDDESVKDEILQPIADMDEDQLEVLKTFIETVMNLMSHLKGEYEDSEEDGDQSDSQADISHDLDKKDVVIHSNSAMPLQADTSIDLSETQQELAKAQEQLKHTTRELDQLRQYACNFEE